MASHPIDKDWNAIDFNVFTLIYKKKNGSKQYKQFVKANREMDRCEIIALFSGIQFLPEEKPIVRKAVLKIIPLLKAKFVRIEKINKVLDRYLFELSGLEKNETKTQMIEFRRDIISKKNRNHELSNMEEIRVQINDCVNWLVNEKMETNSEWLENQTILLNVLNEISKACKTLLDEKQAKMNKEKKMDAKEKNNNDTDKNNDNADNEDDDIDMKSKQKNENENIINYNILCLEKSGSNARLSKLFQLDCVKKIFCKFGYIENDECLRINLKSKDTAELKYIMDIISEAITFVASASKNEEEMTTLTAGAKLMYSIPPFTEHLKAFVGFKPYKRYNFGAHFASLILPTNNMNLVNCRFTRYWIDLDCMICVEATKQINKYDTLYCSGKNFVNTHKIHATDPTQISEYFQLPFEWVKRNDQDTAELMDNDDPWDYWDD